jgi:ribosomal protein L11 methyltransferase
VARRTYEVRVLVRSREAESFGAHLIRLGCGGVEEREVAGQTWLVMYAKSRAQAEKLARLAARRSVEIEEIASDWETRFIQYLRPEPITDRVLLVPKGNTTKPRTGVKRLWFEPGPVFGVGSHPTTRLAARAVEREARGREVLDVGTGTGVLALVAVVSGAKRALGIDLDPKAVASARKNARLNRLERQAKFSQRTLASIRRKYQVVVANIEMRALLPLARQLLRVTGEKLIVTGVLREHEDELRSRFGALNLGAVEDGWGLWELDQAH